MGASPKKIGCGELTSRVGHKFQRYFHYIVIFFVIHSYRHSSDPIFSFIDHVTVSTLSVQALLAQHRHAVVRAARTRVLEGGCAGCPLVPLEGRGDAQRAACPLHVARWLLQRLPAAEVAAALEGGLPDWRMVF